MYIACIRNTDNNWSELCAQHYSEYEDIVLHTLNLSDLLKAYLKFPSEELHEIQCTFLMNTTALDFADKFYFSTKSIPVNV